MPKGQLCPHSTGPQNLEEASPRRGSDSFSILQSHVKMPLGLSPGLQWKFKCFSWGICPLGTIRPCVCVQKSAVLCGYSYVAPTKGLLMWWIMTKGDDGLGLQHLIWVSGLPSFTETLYPIILVTFQTCNLALGIKCFVCTHKMLESGCLYRCIETQRVSWLQCAGNFFPKFLIAVQCKV